MPFPNTSVSLLRRFGSDAMRVGDTSYIDVIVLLFLFQGELESCVVVSCQACLAVRNQRNIVDTCWE
jgi:hypothetical protein